MKDKEIIIDGVDVSKCNWCDFEPDAEPYRRINDGEDLSCEDNPNCYFKQLKRKEQECEKLYIQLETDEEYHKEEENTLRKIIKNKEERNIELYKENNKYKQAIDEIEKNIKDYCKIMCMAETRETCEICQNTEILDIINKAKTVNNS